MLHLAGCSAELAASLRIASCSRCIPYVSLSMHPLSLTAALPARPDLQR